jgi:hypothetical protein
MKTYGGVDVPHRDSNSDPLVVQPVAGRYTDWAILALSIIIVIIQ